MKPNTVSKMFCFAQSNPYLFHSDIYFIESNLCQHIPYFHGGWLEIEALEYKWLEDLGSNVIYFLPSRGKQTALKTNKEESTPDRQ